MQAEKPRVPIEKRIFDLALLAIGSVIAIPLMALIAVLLALAAGLPVIFSQERPGLNGKIFRIYKFRTMKDVYDTQGNLLPDEDRLFPLGRLLRRLSLDELPELWNVLRGEMSLVGPRPLLPQYLPRYTARQARRHLVLPGFTGWAQINGRNAISWEEKFELDNWYVDHWSLCLDIRILFITLWKVLSGEGISQPGRATMDEFMGSPKQK